MLPKVTVEEVEVQPLAAALERVPLGKIGERFKANLDKVYAWLAEHPELRKPGGHNVFLYRRETGQSDGRIGVEFCVQVTRGFSDVGEVFCSWTPPGRIATATHVGPYATLGEAHQAIQQWAKSTGLALAGVDWEIYGDWNDDPAKLETKVCYLLK
jgi:effector-binding domain-containing protein